MTEHHNSSNTNTKHVPGASRLVCAGREASNPTGAPLGLWVEHLQAMAQQYTIPNPISNNSSTPRETLVVLHCFRTPRRRNKVTTTLNCRPHSRLMLVAVGYNTSNPRILRRSKAQKVFQMEGRFRREDTLCTARFRTPRPQRPSVMIVFSQDTCFLLAFTSSFFHPLELRIDDRVRRLWVPWDLKIKNVNLMSISKP